MCQNIKKILMDICIHLPWVIKNSKLLGKNHCILLSFPSPNCAQNHAQPSHEAGCLGQVWHFVTSVLYWKGEETHNILDWDFPGRPVLKTPGFHCRGHGFHSWLENWNPTCCELCQKILGSLKMARKEKVWISCRNALRKTHRCHTASLSLTFLNCMM